MAGSVFKLNAGGAEERARRDDDNDDERAIPRLFIVVVAMTRDAECRVNLAAIPVIIVMVVLWKFAKVDVVVERERERESFGCCVLWQ